MSICSRGCDDDGCTLSSRPAHRFADIIARGCTGLQTDIVECMLVVLINWQLATANYRTSRCSLSPVAARPIKF